MFVLMYFNVLKFYFKIFKENLKNVKFIMRNLILLSAGFIKRKVYPLNILASQKVLKRKKLGFKIYAKNYSSFPSVINKI